MDWPKVIILVDADAFYAAVEVHDHPEYKGKPLIVGALPGTRGVVSTCSYEARKYGVRSAMPIFRAVRLCPEGIFVRPNGKRYSQVSQAMFGICEKYSPIVERVSIDEGYLDVTPDNGVEIAATIRQEINHTLGITVTAGVSYCRYLAKIVAEESKPDGLGVVAPEDALGFLENLPVSKIPGVGPKMVQTLESYGVRTVGNLRSMPPAWFGVSFGKFGERLRELSLGIDPTPVKSNKDPKSISEETTFDKDLSDLKAIKVVLARLSQNVGYRLRQEGFVARTIGIKVRYSDFATFTRAKTLPSPVNTDPLIFACAKEMLEKLSPKKPIRLLGVATSNLIRNESVQQPLFPENDKDWDAASKAVDSLRQKFGKGVVNIGAAIRK